MNRIVVLVLLFSSSAALAETCADQITNQTFDFPSMKPNPVTVEEQKILDLFAALDNGNVNAIGDLADRVRQSPFVAGVTDPAVAQLVGKLNQTGSPLTCALLQNQSFPGRDIAANLVDVVISQFLTEPYFSDVSLTGSLAIQTVIAEQVVAAAQVDAWKKLVPGNWYVGIGARGPSGVELKFYSPSQAELDKLQQIVPKDLRGLPADFVISGKPIAL